MINNGHQAIIAQSSEGQFMCLRTQETPSNVDFKKVDDEQNARITELVGEGKSFSESSQIAAKETAQKYHLAYYEGRDGTPPLRERREGIPALVRYFANK